VDTDVDTDVDTAVDTAPTPDAHFCCTFLHMDDVLSKTIVFDRQMIGGG
jgi:hypothetical protein